MIALIDAVPVYVHENDATQDRIYFMSGSGPNFPCCLPFSALPVIAIGSAAFTIGFPMPSGDSNWRLVLMGIID